ncbi:MAG: FlxA-like family protein [bacterium]|nr:FlxA-like family protein [bacterium]
MRVENGSGAGSAVDAGTMAAIGMQIGQSGQNEDAFSKNIRKQIEQKQQELSELSAKEELSPEEKMKRRQELTKEISDLNMQLRQHRMEKRMQEKAERQKKSQDAQNARNAGAQSAGRTAKGAKKAQAAGFSAEGMSALLSADAAMNQAQVQGSVSNKMENRANVLKQEIKLDSARGGVTERKEAELAGVEAKAVSAAAAQAGSLRDVNESVHDAAEAERSRTAEAERSHTAEAERSHTAEAERSDTTEAERGHIAEAERGNTAETAPSHAAETEHGDTMEAEQSGKTRNAERAGTDAGGTAGTAEKSPSGTYQPVDVRI